MTNSITELASHTPEDDPQPATPEWETIVQHLSDLAEVEEQHTAALAALQNTADPDDRDWLLRAAPTARVRQAADRACALDLPDLLEWGRWAAREIARCHHRLGQLHAELGESERARAALLARAQAAEALSVAQHTATPSTDGPGVTAAGGRRRRSTSHAAA